MEGRELTARERGKVGPVAQSDNDNQGLATLSIPLPTVRVSGAGLNLVKEVPSTKLRQAQPRLPPFRLTSLQVVKGQKEYDNASTF
jgi:hypothetical protein